MKFDEKCLVRNPIIYIMYLQDGNSSFLSYLLPFSHNTDANFEFLFLYSEIRCWLVIEASNLRPEAVTGMTREVSRGIHCTARSALKRVWLERGCSELL